MSMLVLNELGSKVELDAQPFDKTLKDKREYDSLLGDTQLELLHLQRRLIEAGRPLIVLFEGPDAAGKGGVIKRIVEKLDPRGVRVYSITKPSPDELAHHYLWRFWIKMPAKGEVVVFDRSWYGRVLVERVEGFASKKEWRRAFDEINQLEETLVENGTILAKFYLHISKDEQERRFHSRLNNPYKRWKITEEDWRNRRKWKQHNEAAEEMFSLTGTHLAPWYVLGCDHKWFARLSVMEQLIKHLKAEL